MDDMGSTQLLLGKPIISLRHQTACDAQIHGGKSNDCFIHDQA